MSHSLDKQFASNIYYDRGFDKDAAKILPGEYYYTPKDMVIVTVLGSCVSACIRDRVSGIGGMNHFMLPKDGNESEGLLSASMRYGTYAMEILINELLKSGAKRENLEAKVFGGGNVMQGFISMNVGERNAQFVKDYLRAEGIRIVAEDLQDVYPRKVYFFPRSGRVLVKKLRQLHNNTIANREQDYAKTLSTKPVSGDIELFG